MGTANDGEWRVYVLRCGDGTLYTGITLDVSRRIEEHRSSKVGAKYLRGRGPLTLLFDHTVGERAVASAVEHRMKRWRKAEKERLLREPAELRRAIDALRDACRKTGAEGELA